jgi:hypothetical protein
MEIEPGEYLTVSGWEAEVWGQTDDGIWWGCVNGQLQSWNKGGIHDDAGFDLVRKLPKNLVG